MTEQTGSGFAEPPDDSRTEQHRAIEQTLRTGGQLPTKKIITGWDVAREIADRLEGKDRGAALRTIERYEQLAGVANAQTQETKTEDHRHSR
jgi:hypothetical protein